MKLVCLLQKRKICSVQYGMAQAYLLNITCIFLLISFFRITANTFSFLIVLIAIQFFSLKRIEEKKRRNANKLSLLNQKTVFVYKTDCIISLHTMQISLRTRLLFSLPSSPVEHYHIVSNNSSPVNVECEFDQHMEITRQVHFFITVKWVFVECPF